ncbi:YitT family protein [Candidatus Clostridium radicumherbarum]|uniref:YitT family protein n=1 Tax=Candidatus Clostridium radicumherbarum TaxID=3381662 RepID=A0ABW8TSE5_9CLOT
MSKKNNKDILSDFILVTIGCVLTAFSITSILKPNGLITGGITGISIILEKYIYIKYTYIYYALSLLILIASYITAGKKEALKIITLSIAFPLILIELENFNYIFIQHDMLLASVYFGIIYGIGIGLVFKRGFSFGGTDTIAKILNKRILNFISISQILLGIDGVIIAASAIIYNKNIALYAIISQIITTRVIDAVMFGFSSKRVQIEIISEKYEQIADYILHKIAKGVTSYEVKGRYKNEKRLKLQTICSPKEAMLIKKFITTADPEAFVNVISITSVWGGVGFDKLIDEG